MCVSQSNGLFLAHVAHIVSILLLNLSTSPSLCGWYGVVCVLCTVCAEVCTLYSVDVTQIAILDLNEVAQEQKTHKDFIY